MVVFIFNRAPTKALKGKTPFEAWYGRKPSVSFLRTFSCIDQSVYALKLCASRA